MEKSEQTKLLARKLIAILVVFCMLFAHSVVAGSNMVIAVEEALENQDTITKGENIKFDAFFAADDVLHEKELDMQEEQTLYLQIAVKDKFSVPDATIKIEDPNFSINKENIKKNKYIENVDTKNNEIKVKDISSNNIALLQIPIKFERQEQIDSNYFNKEIEIKINGKYLKEDGKEKDLEGMVKIKPIWTTKSDININESISKYFGLGENGTLVEQEIETEVVDNIAPVKTEVIQTQAPKINDEGPKKISVLVNGERLSDENVRYDDEEGVLRFEYNNTDENIKWEEKAEESKRNYTIIYNYSNTAELKQTPVTLRTMVATSLYTSNENIVKEDNQEIAVDPIGNMVTVDTELLGNVYKGYLYANENKNVDYLEKNNIVVSYTEGIESIELKTNETNYLNEQGRGIIPAQNISYKKTIIDKEEITKLLGEEGIVTIKDTEGNTISEITKDTQTNEEGKVEVRYEEGITGIIIETTKPQMEGKLSVINTKLINGVTNARNNVIKAIKQLSTNSEITTNLTKEKATANLELKESTTEAKLEVNTDNMTTAQENKDVEIKVTLQTNDQNQDLYLDPTVIIEFPKDVKEVNVTDIDKIYGDEFTEINHSKGISNGKQAIRIDLKGEQVEHKEKGTEGTVISVKADLKLDEMATTKQDTINMTYSNKKANQYAESAPNGTAQANIEVISPKALITSNNIPALGITTAGNEKEEKHTIPIHSKARDLTIESNIINNTQTQIGDVRVLGTFGTKGKVQIENEEYESNIDSALKSLIQVQGIDENKIKIYYTENENATDDIENPNNRWSVEVGNPTVIRKYLVQISDMDVAQEMKISYNIGVPENLQYNQQMYQGYVVSYNDGQTNENQKLEATTINLKTGKGPIIEAKLTAKVGAEGATEVKNGRNCKI